MLKDGGLVNIFAFAESTMGEENVVSSYVSQKVNKIRWKPEALDDSQYFITGSADEEVNRLTLWYYPSEPSEVEEFPYKVCSREHPGNVTALQFLDNNSGIAISSSSHGYLNLLQVTEESLKVSNKWENVHSNGGTTDVSSYEEDVAAVGEDGVLVLLTATMPTPVRSIAGADSCPIMCVAFLKHNEVVAGNLRGQLKMWDLRAADNKPLSSFMASGGEGGACLCVACHPTQRHLLLAGGRDGGITVWDLRHSTYPVNTFNAHTGPVCEMRCHSERPDQFVACSWEGELFHWNTNSVPWTSSDAAKNRIRIDSLLANPGKPVSSFDLSRTRVLAAADNDAIYLVSQLQIN